MRSDILIMPSWEVMLCLSGGYFFRGTCYPWNIGIHLTTRCHMPKYWNYDLKIQWQSVCKCILVYRQTWNSSILGSRLNFNHSITERLSVKRPCFFYSTNGIQLVPPALRELRLWKPIFTCQSNYMLIVKMIYITAQIFMEWHRKLFILWNLYCQEDFKSLMQCGTAITWEVEVWCPTE